MKVSQTKLLDILLQTGLSVNELSEYFDIILQLFVNHGIVIFSQDYLSVISLQNKMVGDLLLILKKIRYTNQKNISSFYRLLLNHKDYDLVFTLHLSDNNIKSNIHNYLNEKFGKVDCVSKLYEGDGVKIKGGDRYFKKDIDQDINKLLGLE